MISPAAKSLLSVPSTVKDRDGWSAANPRGSFTPSIFIFEIRMAAS